MLLRRGRKKTSAANATVMLLTKVCSGASEGSSPHGLNGEGLPAW